MARVDGYDSSGLNGDVMGLDQRILRRVVFWMIFWQALAPIANTSFCTQPEIDITDEKESSYRYEGLPLAVLLPLRVYAIVKL